MARIIKRLDKIKDAIGKNRDDLRGLEYEITELADGADDAINNITYAVDRLSEHV